MPSHRGLADYCSPRNRPPYPPGPKLTLPSRPRTGRGAEDNEQRGSGEQGKGRELKASGEQVNNDERGYEKSRRPKPASTWEKVPTKTSNHAHQRRGRVAEIRETDLHNRPRERKAKGLLGWFGIREPQEYVRSTHRGSVREPAPYDQYDRPTHRNTVREPAPYDQPRHRSNGSGREEPRRLMPPPTAPDPPSRASSSGRVPQTCGCTAGGDRGDDYRGDD